MIMRSTRKCAGLSLIAAVLVVEVGNASEKMPEAETSGVPLAAFEWTDCGIPERKLFSVSVATTHIQYEGSQYVRERGTARAPLTPSDLSILTSVAKQIVGRKIPDLRDAETERWGVRDAYCVKAILPSANGRDVRGAVFTGRATDMSLIRQVEDVVRPFRWVCPMRAGGWGGALAQELACRNPVIRVRMSEPSACSSSRSIEIFADGTIRQSATLAFTAADGYPFSAAFGDSYFTVGAATLEELVGMAKSFKPSTDELDHPNPTFPYVVRGTAADIARFRVALEERAGVTWIHIPKPVVHCGQHELPTDLLSVLR
jgi:hypothetical protein